MNNNNDKNLKHGYWFLAGFVGILFLISLTVEVRLRSKLKEPVQQEAVVEVQATPTPDPKKAKPKVEITNFKDGFKTKDEKVTVLASTDPGNTAWINTKKVEVDPQGKLQGEVDLIVGLNEILVEVSNKDGTKNKLGIVVTREKADAIPTAIPTQIPTINPSLIPTVQI